MSYWRREQRGGLEKMLALANNNLHSNTPVEAVREASKKIFNSPNYGTTLFALEYIRPNNGGLEFSPQKEKIPVPPTNAYSCYISKKLLKWKRQGKTHFKVSQLCDDYCSIGAVRIAIRELCREELIERCSSSSRTYKILDSEKLEGVARGERKLFKLGIHS